MSDAIEFEGLNASQVEGGLEINDSQNRWWIQNPAQGGNRAVLARVLEIDSTENGESSRLWEFTLNRTTGKPITLSKINEVPNNINLSAPFSDKTPETVLDLRGIQDEQALQAFFLGPVKSLQKWASDRPIDVDQQLARNGLPDFRIDIGGFNPSAFKE